MLLTEYFTRLPPAAAMLILSTILKPASASVMPRETGSAADASHTLAIVDWPLVPTAVPLLPAELRKREFNTVCGWIGGNPDMAATCEGESHCVADVKHKIIGCCPNKGECKSGIFTACVDALNPGSGKADPWVYSCPAGKVCYKNTFDGGFHQYGCGASNMATSVATKAPGKSALSFSQVTASFSSNPTSAPSSTLSSSGSSSRSSSSSASSAKGASQASVSASTTSSAASETADAAAVDHKMHNGGAIAGGVIGGVLGAAILVGLLIWLMRRKNKNTELSEKDGLPHDPSFISRPYGGNGGDSQGFSRGMTDSTLMGNHRPAPAPPGDGNGPSPDGWRAPQDWGTTVPARTYGARSPTDDVNNYMEGDNVPLTAGSKHYDQDHIIAQAPAHWGAASKRRSGNGILWQQGRG